MLGWSPILVGTRERIVCRQACWVAFLIRVWHIETTEIMNYSAVLLEERSTHFLSFTDQQIGFLCEFFPMLFLMLKAGLLGNIARLFKTCWLIGNNGPFIQIYSCLLIHKAVIYCKSQLPSLSSLSSTLHSLRENKLPRIFPELQQLWLASCWLHTPDNIAPKEVKVKCLHFLVFTCRK